MIFKAFSMKICIVLVLMAVSSQNIEALGYTTGFTLRDWGNDGSVDLIEDDANGGWWGSITDSTHTDEHFIEFDISGLGLVSLATLSVDLWNPNPQVIDVSIAYYSGNGRVDTSDFGTGTFFTTVTHTGNRDPNRRKRFNMDVTSIYNSFVFSGRNYLGFRFYDAFHTYGSRRGDQARFDGATLAFVPSSPIPEPSTLLLLSAGLVALVHVRRKFKP